MSFRGSLAQLVERVVRNDEVRGSIPLGSTLVMSRDIGDSRVASQAPEAARNDAPAGYQVGPAGASIEVVACG